ncbi:MAG: cell division protein FtsA [bacterium]
MSFLKKEQIINSLDIGTSVIRLISAKHDEDKKLQIIGVGKAISSGLRKGVVIDIDETIKAIGAAKDAAERASGVPIESAYVNLSGGHITANPSRGTVAVSRADGEVSKEDVGRVINAAQAISLPLNREILRVIPQTFSIDGQNNIKYPVGMNGVRLEVDTLILEASTPIIKNLTKCIHQAGIDILELVPSPLAASYSVLNKRQKELGVVLVDLGAGTTSVAVFEEGNILHLSVLPVGGAYITNDLAIGLKTSIDVAEKVKLEYFKKDQIDLSKISDEEEGIVSKEKIHNIIEARLSEIFALINKELKKIDRQRLLPAGVVLVGGGAKMADIVEEAKEYLSLPAQIGHLPRLKSVADEILDPCFATAIGLILYGLENGKSDKKSNNLINKLKKCLQAFLP